MPSRKPNIAFTNSMTGSALAGRAVGQRPQDPLGLAGRARRVEHGRAELLVGIGPVGLGGDRVLVRLPAGRWLARSPIISSRSTPGHCAAAASATSRLAAGAEQHPGAGSC